MITTITLRRLLPHAFRGMEEAVRSRGSEVWLRPELVFRRGCRTCIAAGSGQGKSTLLGIIYGTRSDYDGEVAFDGEDVRAVTVERWCALRTSALALLPQEMCLFPELTARRNVAIKNDLTRRKSAADIARMFARLGLDGLEDCPAARLSVGQQQRVAIIRALCQPFDFLLLDEPVSHLDGGNNAEVARLVEEEASAQGSGIIVTSVGHHLLLDQKMETIRL